jgi:hypothetical protein
MATPINTSEPEKKFAAAPPQDWQTKAEFDLAIGCAYHGT